MTALLILLSIVLILIIVIQVGKVTELAGKIRGEEEVQELSNKRHGIYSMVFMVVFLIACFVSAGYYRNWMLGYGPHEAASAHGGTLDRLFDTTLFFTGIVFVLTHIALFYFAYKYRGRRGVVASFYPHNNFIEYVWTGIPAIVMTYLVIGGLNAWNEVMADIQPGEDFIEVEATGYQFAWVLRYPGADGKLGTRNFRLIDGTNPLGQDWTDEKNIDDFHPNELVLPVNKKVRVRITARDVLHNFYLPHFRVKMDAVPGMPTYFVFTPTTTTEAYRRELRNYEQYQQPDPNNPGTELWENFDYELACAELCGYGHYSMRRVVRIVEEDEYEEWLKTQQSYYLSTIRNTENDPFNDRLLDFEIEERKIHFDTSFQRALSGLTPEERTVTFDYVNFETGSANLTALSRYELNNLLAALNNDSSLEVELAGHTDNTGDSDLNLNLSRDRAKAVYDYLKVNNIDSTRLSWVGYGQSRPIDTNDTDAGRLNNRRTEFRIK